MTDQATNIDPADSKFKYDVAISFLSEDESIARSLDRLLKKRLSTFVYFDRQENLAGTDGENSFARVFGEESRLVVVLYREKWGQTRFTRFESDAIRGRGGDEGYEFLTVAKLDRDSTLPPWIPKYRLWLDYELYGLDVLAAVIEARVQEAGGEPRIESPADQAERLGRERDFAQKRESLLGSEEGVYKANQEVEQLFAALEREVSVVCDGGSGIRLSFSRQAGMTARLEVGQFYTDVEWHNNIINTLVEARLFVRTFKRGRFRYDSTDQISSMKYQFDILPENRLGWTKMGGNNDFVSSTGLAERLIKAILDIYEKWAPWKR